MAKDFTPSIHAPSANRVYDLIVEAMREAEASGMDAHAEALSYLAKFTDPEFDPDKPFDGKATAYALSCAGDTLAEIMDEHHTQTGVQRAALVDRYGQQVLA